MFYFIYASFFEGMEGLTVSKCYYDLEKVRAKEFEERGENTWWIKVLNVVLVWQDLPKM